MTPPRPAPPAPRPRVLVFGRVRLLREGLTALLSESPELHVVGAASTLQEALDLAADGRVDFVVLDSRTPSSVRVVGELRRAVPSVGLIAFAVDEDHDQILACAQARVSAFLPSDATVDDLVRVIRGLTEGELVCTGRTAAILYAQLQRVSERHETLGDLASLTLREKEVLCLVDRGLSNKGIAQALGIRLATVKNHIHRILDKLGAASRGEAAARLHASIASGSEAGTGRSANGGAVASVARARR